jgi:hypothetical protein
VAYGKRIRHSLRKKEFLQDTAVFAIDVKAPDIPVIIPDLFPTLERGATAGTLFWLGLGQSEFQFYGLSFGFR